MPLTQQSAVALAVEQADVLVVPPLKFVIVPEFEPHTLKLRVWIEPTHAFEGVEKTSTLNYDFAKVLGQLGDVPVFKRRVRAALAELVKQVKDATAEQWRKTS